MKPTIEEVKEYFKNAKEVRSTVYNENFEIDFKKEIKKDGDLYSCVDTKGFFRYLLYDDFRYAEIISYKEPIYKLTAKEVVHAFENPQWLKDNFKECFETKKQNGWYKCLLNENFMAYAENGKFIYGIDGYGDFIDMLNKPESAFGDSDVPSTEEEVFEALKNEAVKRGFKEGVKYKNATMPTQTETLKSFKDLRYNIKTTKLTDGHGGSIFYKGQWATLINQPKEMTIEEIQKELGYKILIKE